MVRLVLSLDSRAAAQQLRRNMINAAYKTRDAVKQMAESAAREIQTRGAADISGAGNYGSDWTQGLHVTVEEQAADNIVIKTTHDLPYFNFLNKGGIIQGKPLLWIPTSWGPAAQGHIPASQYPGRLARVDSQYTGLPMLVDPALKTKTDSGVVYVGMDQVSIPQKFHLLDIIRDVASGLKSKYGAFYRVRP